MSSANAPAVATYRLVAVAAVSGLVAGGVLTILTFLLARYGPSGDSWSFRGNGALVVPFGLGPATLAAGWTMIAAHARSRRRWLAIGIGSGLVGVALVAVNAAALPVGGVTGDRTVGAAALLLLLAWVVAAPLLAALIPPAAPAGSRPAVGPHAAAAVALPVTITLAFFGLSVLLPPGS